MHENKLYDELEIGQSAEIKRVCTARDLYIFAHASGNVNPMHLPDDSHDDLEAVAPSMWLGALTSAVLGSVLPGYGTLYQAQSLEFAARVHVGDELTVRVTVKEKKPDNLVVMQTTIIRPDGQVVASGDALVEAPRKKVHMEVAQIPGLVVQQHAHFDRLIRLAEPLDPIVTAVAAPEGDASLGGALLAMRHSIIVPILIGDEARIRAVAEAEGEDLSGVEIIGVPNHKAAAIKAVQMCREGRAEAVMKGHMHTSELLAQVVKKDRGLRTDRRMSHAFIMDVPGVDHVLIVTDAAVNILPDLKTKMSITQNAIDVARAIGIEVPKVGILSAVETVDPAIPSTLDAAALSKMADRGQIRGGLVDGPLAMDNAMDVEAARSKGITSLVAGHAEVLVVPNLEAGNMVAKELAFIAHAESAGLVLGATHPVILNSRADGEKARLASCAIAALYGEWVRKGGGKWH